MTIFPEFPSADICFRAFSGSRGEANVDFLRVPVCELARRHEQTLDFSSGVENVYKVARQYKTPGDSLKNRIYKCDDSEAIGEYHTVNINDWEEIDWWVSDQKRIGVGRPHGGKDALIFMQVGENGETEKCKNYRMFNKKDFMELRQSRGENKHKRMKIYKDGTVWVGESNITRKFRVFVKKG